MIISLLWTSHEGTAAVFEPAASVQVMATSAFLTPLKYGTKDKELITGYGENSSLSLGL